MKENLPVRVSAVSFLNSIPMVYGLKKIMNPEYISISTDVPSECARKLIEGEVDIGLIPVVEMLNIPESKFISSFCIGATGAVDSVMIASTVPVNEIKRIYTDPHSRTSVMLARILTKEFWKTEPEWCDVKEPVKPDMLRPGEAAVVIGDKAFGFASRYRYDLAEVWYKFTGLPFVFAGWVAVSALAEKFIAEFNNALSWGITHKREAVDSLPYIPVHKETAYHYLENFIEFEFTEKKRQGLELFLSLAKEHYKKYLYLHPQNEAR